MRCNRATSLRIAGAIVASTLICNVPGPSALACSSAVGLVSGNLPQGQEVTLGSQPILVVRGLIGDPSLRSEQGVVVPVEAVHALDGLVDFNGITAWRPVSPLPRGRYEWFGSGESFFVDPELDSLASRVTDATFSITLDEPDEDEAGCDDSTCRDIDFTKLAITYRAPIEESVVILELTTGQGDSARFLARAFAIMSSDEDGLELHKMLVQDRPGGVFPSYKSSRVCVAITPITVAGTLGSRIDLGCARPDDDDPRVTDTRSGCAGAVYAGELFPLAAACLLLLMRRNLSKPGSAAVGKNVL